jgi:hypothetical protein
MSFTIEFLDSAARIITIWDTEASDLRDLEGFLDEILWPPGAVCAQVLDRNGDLVHWRSQDRQPRRHALSFEPRSFWRQGCAPIVAPGARH